jgi:hypothetical protein
MALCTARDPAQPTTHQPWVKPNLHYHAAARIADNTTPQLCCHPSLITMLTTAALLSLLLAYLLILGLILCQLKPILHLHSTHNPIHICVLCSQYSHHNINTP